jgi:peptide/nickel transport system permease protein
MSLAASSESAPASVRRDVWRRFRRNRLGMVGALIVLLLVVMAVFAPQLAPHDPADQDLRARRTPPNAEYLLGADEFGRDILSRIIYGTRASLVVALASVALGLTLGSFLGAVAGYIGGWVDGVIMRTMDLFLAFPYLLLAIIIVSALGAGILNTIVAIAVWKIPTFARVARSAVLQLKERDFVTAAISLGATDARILGTHLLPNFAATLVVYASLYLAYAILMESALSFLGLGVQPPTASWAGMIASGRNYVTSAPHIATIPGIAIAVAVLGFNLLGDGLRDALDPRSSKS